MHRNSDQSGQHARLFRRTSQVCIKKDEFVLQMMNSAFKMMHSGIKYVLSGLWLAPETRCTGAIAH